MQAKQESARVAVIGAGIMGSGIAQLTAVAGTVDVDAAERAAADFLTALGIDLTREERRATPARMARAYADLLASQPFRLTTFPNDEG
ncbi:MAG TPA: 3-hydroxyacyl-CoA dehydrogenase NAD-binding domain-containing protein, partial [Streptosporangiaceae bacterium]|nr:3-hydroxyacyl-CoA dehydrogenase NAD-binding domain-containing protein [Streptosporangiaceae bacterium]